MQAEVDAFDADGARADRFIELVKRYKDFPELTTPMINEFVDKILVYEADKSSGKREQRVDIYLSFIGMFPLEKPERDPAEVEEEQRLEAIRAKRREYDRRYQAKRRAKDKALQPVEPRQAPEEIQEQQHKTA